MYMKSIYFVLILSILFTLTARADSPVAKKERSDKCITNNDVVFWAGINAARKAIYKLQAFKFDSVVFVKSVNRINSCEFIFDVFAAGEYFASAEIVLMKSGWKVKNRKLIRGTDEAIW